MGKITTICFITLDNVVEDLALHHHRGLLLPACPGELAAGPRLHPDPHRDPLRPGSAPPHGS